MALSLVGCWLALLGGKALAQEEGWVPAGKLRQQKALVNMWETPGNVPAVSQPVRRATEPPAMSRTIHQTARPLVPPSPPPAKRPQVIQRVSGTYGDNESPREGIPLPPVPVVDAPLLPGNFLPVGNQTPNVLDDQILAPAQVPLPGQPPAAVAADAEIKYGLMRTSGKGPPSGKVEEDKDSTEMPGPAILFRRDSEKQVFERIVQEAQKKNTKVMFPEDIVISREKYSKRHWPRMMETVEPNYVCHGRLFFEQPNFERAGWELGLFQPAVSLGIFYFDLLTLPYQACAKPLQHTDCSVGKCLPGDTTPLYLYPPHLSLTGLAGEAAVLVGGGMLFP